MKCLKCKQEVFFLIHGLCKKCQPIETNCQLEPTTYERIERKPYFQRGKLSGEERRAIRARVIANKKRNGKL